MLSYWLDACKENGIKEVILDLEANYYIKNKNNIPQRIIDLEKFVRNVSIDLTQLKVAKKKVIMITTKIITMIITTKMITTKTITIKTITNVF